MTQTASEPGKADWMTCSPAPGGGWRRRFIRLLAAGGATIWASGQTLEPHIALAACNNSTNPPPAPPVSVTVANQSFGNTAPFAPYPPLVTNGAIGCDGPTAGDYDVDGNPGLPGQAGGQISTTNTNLTIRGGQVAFGNETVGALIRSEGGKGGSGSEAGAPAFKDTIGGAGAAGGAGGNITAEFNAVFSPDATTGTADTAMAIASFGGAGGAGGHSGVFGDNIHFGGAAGVGGSGGAVTVNASGSIIALTSGVAATSVGGGGGAGGDATTTDAASRDIAGPGGNGGAGGTVTLNWLAGPIQSAGQALFARSAGGRGGDGGSTNHTNEVTGGDGGQGGAGGAVGVVLAAGGTITVKIASPAVVPVSAISAVSNGGDGGNGGVADSVDSVEGGNGGKGGAGGDAGVGILGTVTFNGLNITGQSDGHAVLVQANGGSGGQGGSASGITGGAGGGGFAGDGGGVTLSVGSAAVTGIIKTSGNFAHGALVQSVGGGGGNGGQAGFNAGGGAGAAAGNGGPVVIHAPNASVIAAGSNSIALLAQSIGGGGGSGGDAKDVAAGIVAVAIGGAGGLGGDGGAVNIDLHRGVFGSTSTLGGGGILAQSIGGSGGSGGNASLVGSAFLSMTIGGGAGAGGTGGAVNVTNQALATTHGDHAAGVQAQSIGGGGGKGGNAITFNVGGGVPSVSVAVGGQGGSGGAAGNVTVTNDTGQITTYGADAHGVLIQSIGGGGGSGGAAAARSVNLSPDPDVPAISISVATGGKGGDGNTSGIVKLDNSGLITTAGDLSIGVMAQSIGGGGGTGGDSTAASYAKGPQEGVSISVSVAVGGKGGTGGTGGAVDITNAGLIATLGQDAYGVFAQSIGGGGGAGGGGDATASAGNAKTGFSASVSVGGAGGTGGHAGTASLANSGAVTTRGDGATAVFVQSIGGGGGAGGGGVATAHGGEISASVGVGGNGGAGNDGNTAAVSNSGSIVTRGTDAIGMSVQSIGGGGGSAGKAGATAGGSPSVSNAQSLADILLNGLGFNQKVTKVADGIFQIGEFGQRVEATADELADIFGQPQAPDPSDPDNPERTKAPKINVAVTVGGKGGAAGNGGPANANNAGSIVTYGAQSDGIYAQSVGGGGGSGGAATSTGASANDAPVQSAIGVGGTGGGGGDGGSVTVVNGSNGVIDTQGISAMGIFAQSVGGGGGEGAVAGTVSGSLKSVSIGIGGSGGTGGNGGAVSVTTGDGTPRSYVTTSGKNSIAILAQSVGGGGGVARTMTTDQTFDPAKIAINPQGRLADIQGFSLDLGGSDGAVGSGGTVVVTSLGPVTTQGRNAHGILAQSIGGGGGLVVGGQLNVKPSATDVQAGANGQGGAVSVLLQPRSVVTTAGDGAYGVVAQSIGGGGGLAGDLSGVGQAGAGTSLAVRRNQGDGGVVTVSLKDASIQTNGAFAPAIFAQSVGGGGGLFNYNLVGGTKSDRLSFGTAGGDGRGAGVIVAVAGSSRVIATGSGSAGIFAQSTGTTSGPIHIAIDRGSLVQGGGIDARSGLGAAVQLWDGTANRIENAGIIHGDASANGGVAILTNSPQGNTQLVNSGQIYGQTIYNQGGGSVVNLPGGLIVGDLHLSGKGSDGVIANAGTIRTQSIRLGGGTLTNGGLLDVSTTGATTPTLQGNYRAVPGAVLRVGADFAAGAANHLAITGSAVFEPGSILQVAPASWRKGSVTVVTAGAGLVQTGLSVQPAGPTYLFALSGEQAGNSITVRTQSRIGLLAGGLNAGRRSIAAILEGLWNSDAGLPGTEALATIGDARSYAAGLDSIAGKAVAGIVAAKQAASEQFSGSLFSCDLQGDAPLILKQESCGWIRITGAQATLASSNADPGFRQATTTYQTGGQKEVAPGWFVGGSLGYERNWLTGDGGRSKVSGEVALGGVMVKHQTGPWIFAGVLEGGYGWYASRRQVVIGTTSGQANGTPRAAHTGLHLRVEHMTVHGDWYLKPHLTLAGVYRHMSGYMETGSTPFNLQVKASGAVMGSATPMLEVGRSGRLAGVGTLRGFVGIGAGFYANNDWQSEAGLQLAPAGTPFFTARSTLPNAVGKVSAGLNLFTLRGMEARLTYAASLAPGFAAQSLIGRLAYPF